MHCTAARVPPRKIVTETARYIGNCTPALAIFVIGVNLAGVEPATIWNKDTPLFSGLRRAPLPGAAARGDGRATNIKRRRHFLAGGVLSPVLIRLA